jgi:hypothetical protein
MTTDARKANSVSAHTRPALGTLIVAFLQHQENEQACAANQHPSARVSSYSHTGRGPSALKAIADIWRLRTHDPCAFVERAVQHNYVAGLDQILTSRTSFLLSHRTSASTI